MASVLGASKWEGALQISAAFVCFMLAVAFVGPAGAFAVAIAAEVGTWVIQRYRLVALPVNLAAAARPDAARGHRVRRARGAPLDGSVRDIAALGLVGVGFLALNFVLLRSLRGARRRRPHARRRCITRASCCRRSR